MTTVKDIERRVKREIDKKIMDSGWNSNGSVPITLTNKELECLQEYLKDNNLFSDSKEIVWWEIDGNVLHVTYEEPKKVLTTKMKRER